MVDDNGFGEACRARGVQDEVRVRFGLFKGLFIRIVGRRACRVVEKLVELGHEEMPHVWTSRRDVIHLDPFCRYEIVALAAAEKVQVTSEAVHVGAE